MKPDIGVCFHRTESPGQVAQRAREAEELGFAEFWVIEDCFFTAGVSLAAAALTATERIAVGLGIVPAVARNPAVTAMEFATLAELGPGRFHGGIGHGIQEWMAQMGERRASPVTMLGETLTTVRALLAGERLTVEGRYVTLDRVALELPPVDPPMVSAGVRGPKSLAVAGRRADGVILAEYCSPDHLRWVRRQVADAANDDRHHRFTVFAMAAVSDDGDEARAALAHPFAQIASATPDWLQHLWFFEELSERAATTGWLAAVEAMPAEWWSAIAAVGTPNEAREYLEKLADAGADAIAVFPSPAAALADTRHLAATLLD